ncbi:MAG TPA: hypothetical protein VNT81_23670 [Vicinamibacterales bacterium]|nr:hypothetical protein [Vicinamibacterales bacterium]
MAAISALITGGWRVCRTPWLPAMVYLLLLLVTVPLGILVHLELPEPSRPFAVEPGAGPIPDLDWLDEVTAHKRSLLGALTPAVIGVAAPLSNIDRLLEGDTPTFALLVSGVMLLAWAWLWGGIIARVSSPPGKFLKACNSSFIDVLSLNFGGLVLALLVYGLLRLVLFSVIWPLVDEGQESTLLIWRVVLTLLPLFALVGVTVVFDYARIALVLNEVTVPAAIGMGAKFVRAYPWSVALLVLVSTLLAVGLLTAYAAFEFIPGGSVPTVRRIIELGQLYILARIVLRLWNASAQVALFEKLGTSETRN